MRLFLVGRHEYVDESKQMRDEPKDSSRPSFNSFKKQEMAQAP